VCTFVFPRSDFLNRLVDSLKPGQIIIDVIRFSGPDLATFNNQLMNLELLNRGLAEAVLYSPAGDVTYFSDAFYNKNLLIQRGTYRPFTNTHSDIMQKALTAMRGEIKTGEILPILEIKMHDKCSLQELQSYLDLREQLGVLGYMTLFNRYQLFFELKNFLRKSTQAPTRFVMSASRLEKVFDESRYKHLDGGILEGLGRLLDATTKIYIYPHKDSQGCLTTQNFKPKKNVVSLFQHLMARDKITLSTYGSSISRSTHAHVFSAISSSSGW
jgi:hypothetical protein